MRLSVPTALLALAGCSQEPSLHDAPSAAPDPDPTSPTRSSCGRKTSPNVFCRRGCRTPRRHCCCCFGAYVPVIVEWVLDYRLDVDGGCRSRWSPHGGFTRCMADADGDGTHLRQRWRLRWLCCPCFAYRPHAGNVEGQRERDRNSVSLVALLAGIAVAVCGASAGWPPAEGIGLVIYAAGWVWSLQGWVATLIGSRPRPTYPALSALAAVIWLVVPILIHAVGLLRGASSQPPILTLLLGFVAQLLIGTMSYLLPTTMRGGPGAVRAGVRRLGAGGVFRFALYNLALVTWLLAQELRVAHGHEPACFRRAPGLFAPAG